MADYNLPNGRVLRGLSDGKSPADIKTYALAKGFATEDDYNKNRQSVADLLPFAGEIVGGIGGTITQYSAGTWKFTSSGAQYACSSPIAIQVYTANGMLTTGQTAYYDQYGITPITGYTFFANGGPIYKINSTTGVLEASSAYCSR